MVIETYYEYYRIIQNANDFNNICGKKVCSLMISIKYEYMKTKIVR